KNQEDFVMASPASSATVETSCDTLQAALDVFNGPNSTRMPEGGRQRLNDLAEKHKQAAARAVLLVSGGGSSSSSSRGGVGSAVVRPEELRGIISSLEQSAVALVSYCHGFTACAGPSLKQSLKQLCTAVIKPTQELVEQLLRNGGTEGPRKAFGKPGLHEGSFTPSRPSLPPPSALRSCLGGLRRAGSRPSGQQGLSLQATGGRHASNQRGEERVGRAVRGLPPGAGNRCQSGDRYCRPRLLQRQRNPQRNWRYWSGCNSSSSCRGGGSSGGVPPRPRGV
ncbi:hypothetical protein Vretimale_19886, partial [Volvox reticuliferus]